MIQITNTDRVCICGLPDSGKTFLCRYLCMLAEPDIYIVDPLNQYSAFGEVGDVLAGGKRWVPNPLKGEIPSPTVLDAICKKFHYVTNKVLVVEEAERFMPQARPLLPWIHSLCDMGRNWGIGVWVVTRRIQAINKDFFDLCQHVLFFRCGFKSRQYIADLLGREFIWPVANPQVNKTGYTITTLPDHHFLHFNLETEQAEIKTLKLGPSATVGPSTSIQQINTKAKKVSQSSPPLWSPVKGR